MYIYSLEWLVTIRQSLWWGKFLVLAFIGTPCPSWLVRRVCNKESWVANAVLSVAFSDLVRVVDLVVHWIQCCWPSSQWLNQTKETSPRSNWLFHQCCLVFYSWHMRLHLSPGPRSSQTQSLCQCKVLQEQLPHHGFAASAPDARRTNVLALVNGLLYPLKRITGNNLACISIC